MRDVSYTATIGEDSERDVREAETGTEGSVGEEDAAWRRTEGESELSEAETFWDGPHPSPRSRRPPRL